MSEPTEAAIKKSPHVALALDPLDESCIVVGFGHSREECITQRDRTDALYFRVFLMDDEFGQRMFDWFRSCGLVEADANILVRGVGKTLESIFESRGKEPSDD